MWIIVLSLGIATLLTTLAAIINRRTGQKINSIHLAWIVLLLFMHFNLFWYTRSILSVEKWGFLGFVFTIAGPVLLFLGSAIMVPDETTEDNRDLGGFYFRVSRRFFAVLALLQLWIIGVDILVLEHGFVGSTYFNLASLGIAIGLMLTSRPSAHRAGIIILWFIYLVGLALRGIGIIS